MASNTPSFDGKDYVAVDREHYSPSKGREKAYSKPGVSGQGLEALVVPL